MIAALLRRVQIMSNEWGIGAPDSTFGFKDRQGELIMWKMLITLLFVGALGLSQSAMAQIDDVLGKPAQELLTVHVEVVSQSYCHVDGESFVASLRLRLQFTNISTHSVILSRKIEPPSIVRVARDLQAGEKRDFLFAPDVHSAVAELPNGASFGNEPDRKLFVLLAPGEKFEALVPANVFGANETAKAKKGNGLLAKGSYVLQIGVSTWPYEWPYFDVKVKSEVLSRRWKRYGDLAIGLVYSDFTAFTLPEHFTNPNCPLKP
ncbi:MAG: hypothetical protein WA207_20330 [Candidatus Acidiferrum sp.]